MKESKYKNYDELPLILNAEVVAKVLGIFAKTCEWEKNIKKCLCEEQRRLRDPFKRIDIKDERRNKGRKRKK